MVSLLAPAGSPAAFSAALSAGADEIYLGLETFNARRGAENFTLEELSSLCDRAHLRGVAVNLTLNTLVFDDELEDCLRMAAAAWRAGVDAFIVADLGLIASVRERLPEARLHFSTQLSLTDEADLKAAAAWGAARVTLARELSLPEIERLCACAATLGLEVEVFAHGALCVCYSGQCLLSSMIGGRSANRGRCAQACRLGYALIDEDGAAVKTPGDHLLSPKDLCLIDELDELSRIGVHSLKIEGRMKSPDYVATVTATYRAAIDRLADGMAEPAAASAAQATLEEAFSRGFTTGLFGGRRGSEIMSYDRPNNRGVAIGRIQSVGKGGAAIKLTRPLRAHDVLEVWTRRGRVALEVPDELDGATGRCVLPLGSDQRRIAAGDRVFRVRSAALTFTERPHEPRVPIAGEASNRWDRPLTMTFWPADDSSADAAVHADAAVQSALAEQPDGTSARQAATERAIRRRLAARFGADAPRASAEGPLAQPARTKSLTAEDFAAHIDRLGQTPFRLTALDIALDEGLGIGFSTIHHTRDQAVSALKEALLAPWQSRTGHLSAAAKPLPAASPRPLRIAAVATNAAVARAALAAGAETVYVPAEWLLAEKRRQAGREVDEAQAFPAEVVPVLSPVMHDPVGAARERNCSLDAHGLIESGRPLVVNSLGALQRASDAGAPFEVGSELPLPNAAGLEAAARLGARNVWLSPELKLEAIEELGGKSPVPLGITVSGAAQLMVTEHCLLMSEGPCDQRCARCPRRRGLPKLRDAKGYEFPIITDPLGRSHVYNGVPLDIVPWVGALRDAGVSTFVVDGTLLAPEAVQDAIERVQEALDQTQSRPNARRAAEKILGTTTGHLFRGPD